jgi:hypothetical protein
VDFVFIAYLRILKSYFCVFLVSYAFKSFTEMLGRTDIEKTIAAKNLFFTLSTPIGVDLFYCLERYYFVS